MGVFLGQKGRVPGGTSVQDSRNPGGSQQFPSLHLWETATWGKRDLEPTMTDRHFTLFDTAIGICGIEWGPRGINGVQLPMGGDEKTRARIRQRHGDIVEAEPTTEVQGVIARIVELLSGKPDDLPDIARDL